MSDELETTPTGLDRRTFMKSSAVVGGLVWAAPAMSTFGARAFAGTPDNDLCPPTGRGTEQPENLRFRYTGRGCADTDSPQFDEPISQPSIVFCNQVANYLDLTDGRSVQIRITGGPDGGNVTYPAFEIGIGDTFMSPPGGGRAGANTRFQVLFDGNVVHEVGFHTSCSFPLAIGDRFGSFELISGDAGSSE